MNTTSPTYMAATYDDWGVYAQFRRLLETHGLSLEGVEHVPVARKSEEDETAAAEQATKAYGVVGRDVPAVRDLLNEHPVGEWQDPAVRSKLGIVEVRVADVMPHRLHDDPNGTGVVGDLLVRDEVAYLVIANSGFKSALTPEKDQRNAYTELVVQLLKAIRSANDLEADLALRLARDRTRKGRLAAEMGRLDDHAKRLRVDCWYGDEFIEGGLVGLLRAMENTSAETGRETLVTNALNGRLSAVSNGRLGMSEANLPPSLEHRIDPDSDAIDRRIRESDHLVCFHAHHIQPALAEYLQQLADGAGDAALARVLRKHQVPTTKGQRSGQRSTTFDKIPFAEAERRARRWLTYDDHPVIDDGSRQAAISQRKLTLLREGTYRWQWSNPTPHIDEYDAGGDNGVVPVVDRSTTYDRGRLEDQFVDCGFPDQHVVTTETRWIDATGAPCALDVDGAQQVQVRVVTDRKVLDDAGQPVEWTAWGIDDDVYDRALERLTKRHSGTSENHTNGRVEYDRLLGTPECVTEGRRLQLMRVGSRQTDKQRTYRQRRLVEHPDGPESTGGWTRLRDSLDHEDRAEGGLPDADAYWHATIQESVIVKAVAKAMEEAVTAHLSGDLRLQPPDRAQRQARAAARRADLQAQLDAIPGALARLQEKEAGARALMGRALEDDNNELYEEAAGDRAAAKAAQRDLQAERSLLEQRLATDDEDWIADEPNAPVEAFETVADLIALVEASAADDFEAGRGPGELPADIARHIASTLDEWKLHLPEPDAESSAIRWECTWTITLADGTRHALPLAGTFDTTKYGTSDNTTYADLTTRVLSTGCALDDLVAEAPRPTTPESMWSHTVRPLLKDWGIARGLRGAVIDTPIDLVRTTLAVELGGGERPDGPWDPRFAKHIVAAYDGSLRTSWNSAAVPTDTIELAAVLALTDQHPEQGVTLIDIEATGAGRAELARRMVTPASAKRRTQPSMLRWLDEGVVAPHPCPHDDCPAEDGYATVLVYLPEAVPSTDGSPGGVLCPHCRRLPDLAFAEVRFPPDYVETAPLTGTPPQEKNASITDGRTSTVAVDVPQVGPARLRTVTAIARVLRVTLYRVRCLVDELAPTTRRVAPDGATRDLYDLEQVRELHEQRQQADYDQYGSETRVCECGESFTRPVYRTGRPPKRGPCCLG